MFEDRLHFMNKFLIFLAIITILLIFFTYPITFIGMLGLLVMYITFNLPKMIINLLYTLTKKEETVNIQEEMLNYRIYFSYGGTERYDKVEYQTKDKDEFIYKVLEFQEQNIEFFKDEKNCRKSLEATINDYKKALIRIDLSKYIEEYELIEAIKGAEIALGKEDIRDVIIENSKKTKNLIVRKEDLEKLTILENKINYKNNCDKNIDFLHFFNKEEIKIYFIMFENKEIGYFIREESKINNIYHTVISNIKILDEYNKTEYLFALKLYDDFGIPVIVKLNKYFNQVLVKKFEAIDSAIKRNEIDNFVEYEWYPCFGWWY